jgi:hypothetical protein
MLVESAGGVGQDSARAAGRCRHPHAGDDGLDASVLVEVRAAQEDEHPLVPRPHRPDPARVTGHGRRQETGQVGHRDIHDGVVERVQGGQQTGAEHQSGVMVHAAGELGQQFRGLPGEDHRVGRGHAEGP